MKTISVQVKKERSGPVFLDRDGDRISKVYERENRLLQVGSAVLRIPRRRWVYVIDSRGVWKKGVGADFAGALGTGVGLAIALALLSRVSGKAR